MRAVHTLAIAGALMACGRVGFDPRTGDATAPGDSTPEDSTADAFASCVGGDGLCALACVGTDPDCNTTCGDGTCVGNVGELCSSCPADCLTQAVACGNGACEAGEAGYCYADCGPTPWTWSSDEQELVDAVNQYRTQGVMCPGTAMVVTAPPLTLDPTIQQGAREFVWEVAHQNYYSMSPQGKTCNGRDWTVRAAQYGGYATFAVQYGLATVQSAVTSWTTYNLTCASMMSSAYTRIGAGVAFDVRPGYVVVYK